MIIDRSATLQHDATIVASISGELTIKILGIKNRLLCNANKRHELLPDAWMCSVMAW